MTQMKFSIERITCVLIVAAVVGLGCNSAQAQTSTKKDETKSESDAVTPKANDEKDKSDAEKSSKEKPKDVPAASKNGRAVAAANKFKQDCPCDSCKGKGVLERTKKVDNRDGLLGGGARFATSRQEKKRIRCSACDGARLNSIRVIRGAGERLAEALAQVDTNDPKWFSDQATQESQRSQIKKYVNDVARWGFGNLSKRLNESATSIFADNHTPKTGKPILLIGTLASDERNGGDHRVVVDFVGDRRIIVESPIIFDATEGQNVLVIGSYKSGAGTSTIELEKAIVMTAYDDEALDLDEENGQPGQPGQGGRSGK